MRDNDTNVLGGQLGTLASAIAAEIERGGPMPFDRFMDLALYAPGLGYYVRGQDPFGVNGDFYTAEQLQPVFGVLIAQFAERVRAEMSGVDDFSVVELGAGRGEMAAALAEFSYTPIEVGAAFPRRTRGLVFANEFFDALPVQVAVRRGGEFREVAVAFEGGQFRFSYGPPCSADSREYLERFHAGAPDGSVIEIHLRALDWLDRIACAHEGCLSIVDYGYTAREFPRYSDGTLMSYRRHTASPDVLREPGERDITAHVPFSVFEARLRERGFAVEPLRSLASFLMSVGERDEFAKALSADGETEERWRRMQLKTLLYGMGETFRVLVANSATK